MYSLRFVSLACRPFSGQSSAKQLVTQPDAVRVHDVGLAICGDFGYASLATVPLDIRPAHVVGLPGKPHDATQFVQRRLVLGAEGRQHVAEVNRVFGISIEVSARRQPSALFVPFEVPSRGAFFVP
jgi:hypothetical protein